MYFLGKSRIFKIQQFFICSLIYYKYAQNVWLVFQMGKNPMQSAGCYAIAAAILRNPNCALITVDFSVSYTNRCNLSYIELVIWR